VTGAGGQVGRSLRQELPAARFLTRQDLDVTDGAAVRSLLKGTDVVVHLAAMTNVDRCEAEPDAAERVNGWGTGVVVDAAAASGARVVYLSTDYVFDGRKRGEYIEDDAPAPVNVYGRSKLAGEERVRAREENLIVRTSWVFGDGRNFVRTIVDAARAGRPLRVVDDQRGRPTWAGDLASALAHAVGAGTRGILHVAGDGAPCTWADLAELALEAASLTAPVERIDTDTYRRESDRVVAPRPANSVLSLERARTLGVPLADWRPSVGRCVEGLV